MVAWFQPNRTGARWRTVCRLAIGDTADWQSAARGGGARFWVIVQASRRDANGSVARGPWAEAHGYRHGVATRPEAGRTAGVGGFPDRKTPIFLTVRHHPAAYDREVNLFRPGAGGEQTGPFSGTGEGQGSSKLMGGGTLREERLLSPALSSIKAWRRGGRHRGRMVSAEPDPGERADGRPIGKSATRQVGKPAARRFLAVRG